MEHFHHLLELGYLSALTAGGRIARGGREKVRRVITPIIPQSFIDEAFVVEEIVNRQQFHGRHAERFEMLDGGGSREAEIRTA
jgi:hypothetical protein